MKLSQRQKRSRSVCIMSLAFALLLTSACVKKKDDEVQRALQLAETNLKNQSGLSAKTPEPMRLCVRPAHYMGVKKCQRTGKWVRMSLAANDVDNDRTDVFSNPRISLKKENFYLDTFRFEDGINHQANYPDYFHSLAAYGGFAHFVFAVPSNVNNFITYSFAGRDEIKDNLKKSLLTMNRNHTQHVKIQHWNDRHTYKKFAAIYFEVIDEYSETNYRHTCAWGETDQGYDFAQSKTKEGTAVTLIPETYVWRKPAETCEQIPSKSPDSKFNYLEFKDIGTNSITKDHKFSLENRNFILQTNHSNPGVESLKQRINFVNPMAIAGVKTDGTMPRFKNLQQHEISRWEAIFDEDLKDQSFQPERVTTPQKK